MIGLIRYIAVCCLASQRWVAPALVFGLAIAVTYVSGGDPLATLAEGATWLFPISAWIAVATLNDEDPTQADITASAANGPLRARFAKLLVAVAVGAVLTTLSLLLAAATNARAFTIGDLGAGLVAHLLCVVSGVALGSLVARPVLTRTGWSVVAITGLTVVDLAVPDAPPLRAVLTALTSDHAHTVWPGLLLSLGEVILLACVCIAASSRVSGRKR